jgi:hypothetical protein
MAARSHETLNLAGGPRLRADRMLTRAAVVRGTAAALCFFRRERWAQFISGAWTGGIFGHVLGGTRTAVAGATAAAVLLSGCAPQRDYSQTPPDAPAK